MNTRKDERPHEVNIVMPDESVLTLEMFAVPNVNEVVQIRGRDYRVASRNWTIDQADSLDERAARIIIGLSY